MSRARRGVTERWDALGEFLAFWGMGDLETYPPARLAELKEYWSIWGEDITAEHMERHPGTRPEPWWQWTHKSPSPAVRDWHRDQADYLDRMGLLTEDEREALGR